MSEAIKKLMQKYTCHSVEDCKNALKEIIQEIALVGLWRANFFDHAAFYGGTALRILHGLDRFSEDLDFSLLKKNKDFDLNHYKDAIKTELASFGFKALIEKKEKTVDTAIQSAFIKAGCLEHLLYVENTETMININKGEILKVKIEVDLDPPIDFLTETEYLITPVPISVSVFSKPDLFAGKMHALLCRKWKNRVKGRDWYDLIWFVSNNIPLNLKHLETRMKQSGHFPLKNKLTNEKFFEIFNERIHTLDIKKAKEDIIAFIKNPSLLNIWSKEFFSSLTKKIKFQ